MNATNVAKQDYCSSCQCLDPNVNTGVDSFTTSACDYPFLTGDDYCDDETNNEECEWDGGDCCSSNADTEYYSYYECLDPDAAASRKKRNVYPMNDIKDSNDKTTFISPRKKRNINLQNNDGPSGKILLIQKYIFHHMFKNCFAFRKRWYHSRICLQDINKWRPLLF